MQHVKKNDTGCVGLLGTLKSSTTRFLIVGSLLLSGSVGYAQNASYNLNSIPIGGVDNSAFGFGAMNATAGVQSTALGKRALTANTTGSQNAANGFEALRNNTTGNSNTGIGFQALANNSIGGLNTAVGMIALTSNTTGNNNTSIGVRTLTGNLTGSNNTGLGWTANVAAANLNNATAVGSSAVVNASNKVRLGNAVVTVIEGQVAYTFPSDGRFKNNISTSDVKGLDFITRLRPVVYNFDTRKFQEFLVKDMPADDQKSYLEADFGPSTAVRQSGFIAQEVELAAKEVGYDFNGVHVPVNESDNYSVAYSQFVVPLVKAVQEQQVMIEQQDQQIAQQQQQIDELKKMVAAIANAGNSADDNVARDIKIYPNPTGGVFSITTKQLQGGVVEVYNLAGEKIHQADLKSNTTSHQVDLASYPRGMYLVTIRANGKELTTQKLMLQ